MQNVSWDHAAPQRGPAGSAGSLTCGTHAGVSETVSRLATDIGGDLLRAALLDVLRPMLDGRYRIERVLGRGATGVVLRARDERLGRDVAIKMAPASAESLQMLEEARALAQLKRPPCVVQVWETASGRLAGSSCTQPINYIVMELVVGVTLREWQLQGRSAAEVLSVYANVAAGLHTVHAHGIAHGDVKADNVIMDGTGLPILVDFGFAARMQERGFGARRAVVLGTPPYMAPEARLGQIRRKGDVHAYAVSLWEALTGELPFTGDYAPVGPFGIKALRGERALPPKLRRILKSAMRPLPELRPSVAEVHRVVQEHAALHRVKPGSRRFRLGVVTLVAIVAFAGLSLAGVLPPPSVIIDNAGSVLEGFMGWVSSSPTPAPVPTEASDPPEPQEPAPPLHAAETAFQRIQAAWSSGTEEEYLEGYEPRLACYYNVSNYDRTEIHRAQRYRHFARSDRPPVRPTRVSTRVVSSASVVLRESAAAAAEGEPGSSGDRVLEMHLSGDGWRIRQEVSTSQHRCWIEPRSDEPVNVKLHGSVMR